MSTDSQEENSLKPSENDSPRNSRNTILNSNSDENNGLLKPRTSRRKYSSRTVQQDKSLATKSTTFAPFGSSESSVGTIATRRGTSKSRKSRKSSRKSRSSINRRRSSRRSTTANLRRNTSRAKSIITTKASGTNVGNGILEDGKPSISMNDKGAIRLMLPGKIQHKTTIKLSHYPEQGNDSIEVNIPTTIASPAGPEIQSPITNIPIQSSYQNYQMPLQMPIQEQTVCEPTNENQQYGGDLADAAQAFNALMSSGTSDQSNIVNNLQQQLQQCQQQQQYQQQQYLQYQQAMTQAYMSAYQNPYCCYPYDSSYYQQYQYGGYPPY